MVDRERRDGERVRRDKKKEEVWGEEWAAISFPTTPLAKLPLWSSHLHTHTHTHHNSLNPFWSFAYFAFLFHFPF